MDVAHGQAAYVIITEPFMYPPLQPQAVKRIFTLQKILKKAHGKKLLSNHLITIIPCFLMMMDECT